MYALEHGLPIRADGSVSDTASFKERFDDTQMYVRFSEAQSPQRLEWLEKALKLDDRISPDDKQRIFAAYRSTRMGLINSQGCRTHLRWGPGVDNAQAVLCRARGLERVSAKCCRKTVSRQCPRLSIERIIGLASSEHMKAVLLSPSGDRSTTNERDHKELIVLCRPIKKLILCYRYCFAHDSGTIASTACEYGGSKIMKRAYGTMRLLRHVDYADSRRPTSSGIWFLAFRGSPPGRQAQLLSAAQKA